MNNKWAYIAIGCAWIVTSIAVSYAIYITNSATPLWALLIPSGISFRSKHTDDEDKNIKE